MNADVETETEREALRQELARAALCLESAREAMKEAREAMKAVLEANKKAEAEGRERLKRAQEAHTRAGGRARQAQEAMNRLLGEWCGEELRARDAAAGNVARLEREAVDRAGRVEVAEVRRKAEKDKAGRETAERQVAHAEDELTRTRAKLAAARKTLAECQRALDAAQARAMRAE